MGSQRVRHDWVTELRLSIEIGSIIGYKGWEFPQAGFCKLENQESQRYNLVPVQRPEYYGSQWYNSQYDAKGLRTWRLLALSPRGWNAWEPEATMPSILAQKETIRICPSFTFFLLFGPSADGWCLPHWWGQIFFIQSIDSNANLFQKCSHTHPEILFYQLSGYPLAQSSWHIKSHMPLNFCFSSV